MKIAALAVVLALAAVAQLAVADDAPRIPPEKLAAFCAESRASRAKIVQDDTRAWLARVAAMRAACRVGWIKTGAMRFDRDRAYPELKGDVQCPKGPPQGETKESVWNVLSLFLEEAPLTDERITSAHASGEPLHIACETDDAKAGLVLRVLVNDEPGLRKILVWRAPTDGGVTRD